MSLLLPDTGLLFWMVLIFAIVFFMLAKFGFPVITGMVQKRCDHIDEALEGARKAEIKLSKLADEQAALLQQTRVEQGQLVKEATATREQILAQAKAQAQEEAAKIIENAKKEIAIEKEAALRDIRSQVGILSMKVAEKIIRKELSNPDEQLALVDRMIDEISKETKAS